MGTCILTGGPFVFQDGQKKRKAGENTVADRAGKRQALLSEVLGTEVLSGRPVEPDTRGTSDPALRLLRTFHSHREGIVDMTQAVRAARAGLTMETTSLSLKLLLPGCETFASPLEGAGRTRCRGGCA